MPPSLCNGTQSLHCEGLGGTGCTPPPEDSGGSWWWAPCGRSAVPQPGARSPLRGLLRSPSTSAQGTRVEMLFTVPAGRETTVVPLGQAGLSVELEKPSPGPQRCRTSWSPETWPGQKPECPHFSITQSINCLCAGCQSLVAPRVATGIPGFQL